MRAISRRVAGKLEQDVAVRDHRLTADEPREHGGEDSGPSPQELLAASLASCTAITMEMYAERKGWDMGDAVVEVEAESDAALVDIDTPEALAAFAEAGA